MQRVSFVTLGCKVNQTETDAIAEQLGPVVRRADQDQADVVVINTCTVTAEADRKARKAVRHALGLPGSPVVVVTGCLAAMDADGLRALGDRVVVEADKDLVAARVRERRAFTGTAASASHLPTPTRARARVQVKVEDGCDAFCTYCIVPYARGLPRPVPQTEVVRRVRELAEAGVAEVVLTGINIGRYEDGARRLPDLLRAVAATGIRRIRLSSIEPGDVSDRLLDAAAETESFCRHLHIPLQSGADGVLARMGRPYDAVTFARILENARRAFPDIALSTDVIAGFPGETDEDAATTLRFVASAGFSRLHVFRYSARSGTPAASMPGQVPPAVRSKRAAALRDLGARLAEEFAASRVGRDAEVLVERQVRGADGATSAEGATRDYLRVIVPMCAEPPGALLPVMLEGTSADGVLIGRMAR